MKPDSSSNGSSTPSEVSGAVTGTDISALTESLLPALSSPMSLGDLWKGQMKSLQLPTVQAVLDGAYSFKSATRSMGGTISLSRLEDTMAKPNLKFLTYSHYVHKFVPIKELNLGPGGSTYVQFHYNEGKPDESILQVVLEDRGGKPHFTVSISSEGQYARVLKGSFAKMREVGWLPKTAKAQLQLYKRVLRDVLSHIDEGLHYVIDLGGQKQKLRCRCGQHKFGPDSSRNCGTFNATMDRARNVMNL